MLFLLLTAALLSCFSGSAATISILPSSVSVAPGQIFTLDIAVSDVTDLYAFEFDLGFNPAVLSANGVTEGPFLATGGSTFFIEGAIDNTTGAISATGNSLLTAIAGVSGNGVLARASFTALAPGATNINLFGILLLDSSLSGIPVTNLGGTVTVDASGTPEPATWTLLLAGLVLLHIGRRRLIG